MLLLVLGAVLLAASLATVKGCGCGRRDGDLAAPAMASRPASSTAATSTANAAEFMEGAWEGRWASSTKNLSGKLTCTITKVDAEHYAAVFLAQSPLGTQKQAVTLEVQKDGGVWKFHGRQNLGLLVGGIYTYDGQTDGQEFYCTYDSSFDKGVFKLRPAGTASEPAGEQ